MSTHPPHEAWTGGSSPRPYPEVAGEPEGAYVAQLYAAELKVWQDHWQERAPLDVRKIFWAHARYDAHATYRAAVDAKASRDMLPIA